MVHSMIIYMDLLISLWGYAILTMIYLLNWVLTKYVATMSYEIWVGKPPSLKHIRIWGCLVYIKMLKIEKLELRFEK